MLFRLLAGALVQAPGSQPQVTQQIVEDSQLFSAASNPRLENDFEAWLETGDHPAKNIFLSLTTEVFTPTVTTHGAKVRVTITLQKKSKQVTEQRFSGQAGDNWKEKRPVLATKA